MSARTENDQNFQTEEIDDDNTLLIEHLTEQGLNQHDIEQVISKLNQRDKQTFRESVFDSIERGSFNLKAIIAEAIGSADV